MYCETDRVPRIKDWFKLAYLQELPCALRIRSDTFGRIVGNQGHRKKLAGPITIR